MPKKRADAQEHESDDQTDELALTATMYYVDGRTQSEVANELGISRQAVQRRLQRARDEGIVEVYVHSRRPEISRLESTLCSRFGLASAIVVSGYPDLDQTRSRVTRAAGKYLAGRLEDSMVVAVGMGRHVAGTAAAVATSQSVDVTFVAAMGGSPMVDEAINPNSICQTMAQNTGGRTVPLYAPAYVDGARARALLLDEETIRLPMELAESADIAVVGIGTPDPGSTLVAMGSLSLAEVSRIRDTGAISDILGDFVDLDGMEIPSELHDRRVGLRLSDLRVIPEVIAVTSDAAKSDAVLGALRVGLIGALVCDDVTAERLLEMSEDPT